MPEVIPPPDPTDIPINETASIRLEGNQKATATFTASQRTNDGFVLPIVAASKWSDSSYTVKLDGDIVYGPASIPPTDIDDLEVCFLPAFEFDQEIEVEVANLSTDTRTYHIQPVGYERGGA